MADLQIKKPLQTAGGQLVNYSSVDVQKNVIYTPFYVADCSSGALVCLSEQVYAEKGYSSGAMSSLVYSGALYQSFSINFNRPLNINGDILINIPYSYYTQPATVFFTSGAIWKVSDSIESYIGQSSGLPRIGTADYIYNVTDALKINTNNNIHFKIGDSLLFRISLMTSGATMQNITRYFNPLNSTLLTNQTITQLKILLPSKIEVD